MRGRTASTPHGLLRSPLGAGIAALVPGAAVVLAMAASELWADVRPLSLWGLLASAPFYVLFVALPSLLPIGAVRTPRRRLLVTGALTVVAGWAGYLVVSTDDAQAGLAALWVPYVAIPLGAALWIGRAIAESRHRAADEPTALAPVSHRIAALVIDVGLVGAVLFAPVTRLSHGDHEIVAVVVGIAVGTAYVGALTAWRGRTLGQAALGLRVTDEETTGRVPPARALSRSLIVVLQVAVSPFVLAAPVVVELVAAAHSGRTLTDRLVGTRVVTGA